MNTTHDVRQQYFAMLSIEQSYLERASRCACATKYAHNISKAAEYATKAKMLGRYIDRLDKLREA